MVGFNAGWMTNEWIIAFALLMSVSFLISSPLNTYAHDIFDAYRPTIMKLNTGKKYIDDEPKSIGDAEYLVVGFGSIGKPAYQYLSKTLKLKVIAVDYNHEIVKKCKNKGVNIIWGDTTNSIFWDTIDFTKVKVVLLAMSDVHSNINTLREILKLEDRHFKIAAYCNYHDEAQILKEMKVDYVYDFKMYMGEDFAQQVHYKVSKDASPEMLFEE